MKIIDKIALIYLKEGKILATRSKGKEIYYLPGGKREIGESDQETLIRECKEELSVNILPETIRYYGTFEAHAHGEKEDVLVKITCYQAKFQGELKPSSEIDQISWLSYCNLEQISEVDQLIYQDLYQKKLLRRQIKLA